MLVTVFPAGYNVTLDTVQHWIQWYDIVHLFQFNIEETRLDRSGYVSNIFIRPKTSWGHRLILNVKDLNDHIEYHHFKMDHLSSVLPLISKNCYLASLDLVDVYYSVNVRTESPSACDASVILEGQSECPGFDCVKIRRFWQRLLKMCVQFN